MILTVHAITGATLASLVPNQPVTAFAIGFASHFILDALPHWEYSLNSTVEEANDPMSRDMIIGKKFVVDLLKISLDVTIGILISYLIFIIFLKYSIFIILCGVIGGVIPDALQFAYMKWRHEPLITLQRFHTWVHVKR